MAIPKEQAAAALARFRELQATNPRQAAIYFAGNKYAIEQELFAEGSPPAERPNRPATPNLDLVKEHLERGRRSAAGSVRNVKAMEIREEERAIAEWLAAEPPATPTPAPKPTLVTSIASALPANRRTAIEKAAKATTLGEAIAALTDPGPEAA